MYMARSSSERMVRTERLIRKEGFSGPHFSRNLDECEDVKRRLPDFARNSKRLFANLSAQCRPHAAVERICQKNWLKVGQNLPPRRHAQTSMPVSVVLVQNRNGRT